MAIDKITADGIADNAIGTSKIGADVIVAEDIAANAITVSEIQDNAVTTAKILDANITTAKIADLGVTHAKLHNTMDLSSKTVTLPSLASLAVTGDLTVDTSTLKVDSANNRVGVGTTSPDGALHVKGMSDHGKIIVEHGGTSGTTNHNFISFHNHAGNTVAEIQTEENATNQSALVFKTGGTTTNMTVSHTGNVTKPNQPSFYAYPSASQVAYTADTWSVVQFNTTGWNVGGHYNTSNYRWTVPVAGKYLINWMLQLEDGNQPTWIYAYPIVNGNRNTNRSKGVVFADFRVSTNYHTESGSWIMNLAANDYITFDIHTSGSTKNFKGESHWSGILLS